MSIWYKASDLVQTKLCRSSVVNRVFLYTEPCDVSVATSSCDVVAAVNEAWECSDPDIWIGDKPLDVYKRPCMKFAPGNGFQDTKLDGVPLSDYFNTYFCGTTGGSVSDIIRQKKHDDKFVHAGDTLAFAIHVLYWLGFSDIVLVTMPTNRTGWIRGLYAWMSIFGVRLTCVRPDSGAHTVPEYNYSPHGREIQAPFSVGIPAYKAQDYLQRCIDSVASQSLLPRVVHIGVDGCDATLEAARGLDTHDLDVRVHHFKKNRGPYAVRNDLIDRMDTDQFVLFDADDEMRPEHCETCMRWLRDWEFYVPLMDNVYDSGSEDVRRRYRNVGCGLLSGHKEPFQQVGGYKNVRKGVDGELIVRATLNGCRVAVGTQRTVTRHIHGQNLTLVDTRGRTEILDEVRQEVDDADNS